MGVGLGENEKKGGRLRENRQFLEGTLLVVVGHGGEKCQ